MTHYAGIDFSGAREPLSTLWSAVGVARDGRLHILALRPQPFRRDLHDYVVGGWRSDVGADPDARCLWGADFPFGIPLEAATQLGCDTSDWRSVAATLARQDEAQLAEAIKPLGKMPRRCDAGVGLAPLDLRLARQTLTGMRWLLELADEHRARILPVQAQGDGPVTLIEVYPSATRTDLGLKAPRKPRRAGEVRARPAALRDLITFDHGSMAATAVALEDAWDAVLAALSAFLVRDDMDQPTRVAGDTQPIWQREGWIYRHPQAVG